MLFRTFGFTAERGERASENGDLVIEMAFASEEPYERWWGIEVLDHGEKSVRLQRLNDGAPLLYNHNWDELRGTHVPGSVRIDQDRRLRGKVKLESVTPEGRNTIGLVEAGHLTKTSVGYAVHKVVEQSVDKTGKTIERELDGSLFERVLERSKKQNSGDLAAFRRALDAEAGPFERRGDTPVTYRVMDWEPHENSLVTVPADNTVGVGRMAENSVHTTADTATTTETKTMSKDKTAPAGDTADNVQTREAETAPETRVEVRDRPAAPDAAALERKRVADIRALCEKHHLNEDYQRNYINAGFSPADVGLEVLKVLEERGRANPQPLTKIGLNDRERNQFSLSRAIVASLDRDWKHAGFERECCMAVAEKSGKPFEPGKFVVPFEVLERQHAMPQGLQQRAQLMDTALSSGAGGYLVGTDNVGFIEALYNRSVALRMGARRLAGLVGNVTIPRQSASATAAWLTTEATDITDTGQTFVQVSLTPHNVGAYTRVSRQLILQSQPAADGIIASDLANVVAVAADLAMLHGTNSGGQPQGLVGTSGVGSVTSTGLDYADVLGFQEDLAVANVTPQRGGYVTTVSLASVAKQKQRFSSTDTPLWVGNIWNGMMEGFPAMSSNQVTSGYMLFGDWQELIMAEWGMLEVEVNPYDGFAAGIIGVRAMYSMDVGVRRPAAFSVASGVVA